ncbi:DNA polymerase II large subunit [Clarias magur]|uniref:DNA polymerase II large subunit n=1 Tax=Clarias magur TaxID=1594786 RepID=A0A8J4TM81_CLAMG|nr:DNA polymerase II large subunit [Clarias magur]
MQPYNVVFSFALDILVADFFQADHVQNTTQHNTARIEGDPRLCLYTTEPRKRQNKADRFLTELRRTRRLRRAHTPQS